MPQGKGTSMMNYVFCILLFVNTHTHTQLSPLNEPKDNDVTEMGHLGTVWKRW